MREQIDEQRPRLISSANRREPSMYQKLPTRKAAAGAPKPSSSVSRMIRPWRQPALVPPAALSWDRVHRRSAIALAPSANRWALCSGTFDCPQAGPSCSWLCILVARERGSRARRIARVSRPLGKGRAGWPDDGFVRWRRHPQALDGLFRAYGTGMPFSTAVVFGRGPERAAAAETRAASTSSLPCRGACSI